MDTVSVQTNYLEPTQQSGRALFMRKIAGPVTMLNLLRFRATADYTSAPQLAPEHPISGAKAYWLYFQHTLPLLRRSGGEVLFFGTGGPFLIGPIDEQWDAAMLIRQNSLEAFMAFASHPEYLAGIGHRRMSNLNAG